MEDLKPATFGIRHLQCFLLSLGLAVGYAMRVNLSVAIVAMTDLKGAKEGAETFQWSEKEKSLILSSFFWGYVITQIPAGHLCRKYGAKVLFLWGNALSAVLALLTPYLVSLGDSPALMAVRVVQGLGQGVLFPCTHSVLSQWSPPGERATLCSFAYAGTFLGAVLIFGSSGWLISCLDGWPSIFYISGILGFVWCIIWYLWGSNRPHDFKRISLSEKTMILNSLGAPIKSDLISEKSTATPWVQIITSLPCWALLIDQCAHNWGFWTLLTQLPTYMKHVLAMDIKSNALFSALPYLIMLMLTFLFGFLANILYSRHWMSTNMSRKLFNTLGQWTPAITLAILAFCDSSHLWLAVTLIILSVGLNSASFLGFQVNHMDLSPNYAGVLMGLTNCAANVMSILAPLMVGLVVKNESDPLQWRTVFFASAGFYFVGNLLFLIFGRTSVQEWNDPLPKPAEMQLIQSKEPQKNGINTIL